MKIIEKVREHLEEQKSEIIKYLQKLVRIDTHVPPGLNYDKICKVMAERFNDYGCSVEITDATEEYLLLSGRDVIGLEGPRSNVVARYPAKKGSPIMHVSAHIDTAPIQAQGWTVDPVGGDFSIDNPHGKSLFDKGGGYVWGRGACDDKSMCVAMTYALDTIHALDIKLDGELILTGNCDEEIGGVAGLGYLIKEGIVRADYGIQLDGDLNSMGLAAQGRTRFLIQTFGKSWHGQVPILGINAIEKMSKINVALNNYWRNNLLHRQRKVPGIDLPSDLKDVGIDKLTAMLNIGTIKGGVQGATVPDKCEEEVLRGMVPGETFEEVKREFISVLEGVKTTDSDLRYEVEVINSREGYLMDPSHEYIQSSKSIVENVLGRKINFSGNLASTDMNYQLNDGKMPCFTLGVGEQYANVHKQNESVAVDDLIKCTEAVTMLCINFLSRKF